MCASKSLSCVCAAAGPPANKASRTAPKNRIIWTLLAFVCRKEGLAPCPPATLFFCIHPTSHGSGTAVAVILQRFQVILNHLPSRVVAGLVPATSILFAMCSNARGRRDEARRRQRDVIRND